MKRIFALPLLLTFAVNAHAAEVKLRLATYNIKGLPFPIQLHHYSRYKKIVKEIRAMVKAGKGPDVIFIQEAFSAATSYLYQNLKDLYPNRVRGPGRRIRWNSGLEILSRYPITDSWITAYSSCDSFDCLARKGVLHARVKTPKGEIDLYDTHMQANNKGRGDVSARVREQQAGTMIRFVNNTRTNGLPFFMAGDFNFRSDTVAYGMFLKEFGDIETGRYCQTHNSCPGYGKKPADYWVKRIDHLFYGGGKVTPVDYESYFSGTDYSDHDMIMGTYLIQF